MSYSDFWFVETRVQTNNLKRYLIYFVIIFAFVSIGSVMAIKTMYKDIKSYEINTGNLNVTVSEAKATNVNGYVEGKVINQGNEPISGKYLAFLLYNEDNKLVSTEYIDIGTIEVEQVKDFKMKFKYDNIERFVISVTDTKE